MKPASISSQAPVLARPLPLLFAYLVLAACWSAAAQPIPCPAFPSRIDVENGTFSSQPGVSFKLHHFAATLVPEGRSSPACLSKLTMVSHARITVDDASQTKVFQGKLSQTSSKIRDLTIETTAGNVTIRGKITKIVPLDFSIAGPVSTDGNVVRMDISKIKADGIPLKALLAMLQEHLSSMLGIKDSNGLTVTDNQLAFSPEKVAHLKGHIQSVQAVPGALVLTYSQPAHSSRTFHTARAVTPPAKP